jgi:hypothetical protein
MILGHRLDADRDKAAYRLVAETKETLGDKPIHMLLKALLEENPDTRPTARQALKHEVFAKFKLEMPPVRLITSVQAAMGTTHPEPVTTGKSKTITKTPLQARMANICMELGCYNPVTVS